MNLKSILSGVETAFSNFFTKAPQEVDDAFTGADKVVNILKTISNSDSAKTIEAVVEAFAPGVSNVVFGALNTFFTDFGFVEKTATGLTSEISAKGLSVVNTLQGDSKTLALSNVSSIIGHSIAGGASTLQQAIVVNQIVHDQNVLTLPVAHATTSTQS